MTSFGTYRPEVDGLRAIAILLTCLFHFNIANAHGGFLGIPIFFVVSGYLVGGIIFRSIEKGDFSLFSFWRRRLARILPALLFICLLVLFSGYFILLPEDYLLTSSTIVSSLFLYSNHYLYGIQDYFGPAKYEVHFLHSWSLSVEEQFYILFPIFAWALSRFKRGATALLGAAVVCGFALYVWGRYNYPVAAHYFLATRAWELLAGAFVFVLTKNSPNLEIRGSALPWLGLIMTVGPAFMPQSVSTTFGIAMHLSVVLGTSTLLCCIDAKQAHPVQKLLSSAPMRGLGLISYSLYLIHWPLLTLSMYFWINPIPTSGRLFLFATSILLAWGSWRLIEVPMRRLGNARETSNRQVFLVSALSISTMLLAAQLVLQFRGFPDRVTEQVNKAAHGSFDFSPLRARCHSHETSTPVPPSRSCLLGNKDLNSTLAVWGDSHGVELSYALAETGEFKIRQLTSSSCPPLINSKLVLQNGCASRNGDVVNYLEAHPEIQSVVLVQHYFGYEEIGLSDWLDGLEQTVITLRKMGRTVILLGPLPYPRRNIPSDMARTIMFDRNIANLAQSRSQYDLETSPIIVRLKHISAENQAQFIDLTSTMCSQSHCPFVTDNIPLYFDDNHLSLSGARLVAAQIVSSTGQRISRADAK